MQRETAPFSLSRNGYHISWDAIPAWIREQCGESLFEKSEVDTIQSALAVLEACAPSSAKADATRTAVEIQFL